MRRCYSAVPGTYLVRTRYAGHDEVDSHLPRSGQRVRQLYLAQPARVAELPELDRPHLLGNAPAGLRASDAAALADDAQPPVKARQNPAHHLAIIDTSEPDGTVAQCA
ncbi:MAG TPA: hypothetical protein VF963_00570 [Gaiellaceae bacterium]